MMDEIFSSSYIRSLCIMGGTFDPIHYGHLIAAETIRQAYNVDKVVFVPTGDPPHKSFGSSNDKEHRYLMTVLATMSNPHFDVSRIEIERDGYSYSVDTMSRIVQLCPREVPVYFIIGADTLMEMPSWKNPEKLFSMCRFVAVTRPGYNKEMAASQAEFLREKFDGKINLIDIPSYNISSTDIRQKLQNGESIRYMVPDEVYTYIQKNGLYRDLARVSTIDYSAVTEYLMSNLSKKRMEHVMGVADIAVRLAKLYGANEDKAYVAGLIHDMAKDIPDDVKLEMCREYGIEIDEFIEDQPDLAHGFLGAEMAQSFFGVNDKDILNSVRYHTIGRSQMSMLERIILLADVLEHESNSKGEPSKTKKLAEKNLNKAVISAIIDKIQRTESHKHKIHPSCFEALKFLEQDS